jgi:hypothetical protein
MKVKQKKVAPRTPSVKAFAKKHAFILHYSFFVSYFFSKTYSIRILIVDVVNFLFNV